MPRARAAARAAWAWASEWTMIRLPLTPVAGSAELAHRRGGLDHAVGEAPLVVVPRQHPAEPRAHHLRLSEVEGRARGVEVEVGGDQLLLVDGQDAAEAVRVGGTHHELVDLLRAGIARRRESEIDQRHVGRRHADRGAVELALEG